MDEEAAAGTGLRDRKKAMTRAAIVEAAQRLFDERGYDDVTVAEIADAANIAVKTLFVYVRSKEDLAFADTSLIDRLVRGLERRGDRGAGAAFAAVLLTVIREQDEVGIDAFRRDYGDSPALRNGLLRMWAHWEDRVTATLAAAGGPTAADRLVAIRLVGIVRAVAGPEMALRTAGLAATARKRAVTGFVRTQAKAVDGALSAGRAR